MRPQPSTRSTPPFVFLNAAITADGKIAFNNGAFEAFGSRRDHEQLLHHRTRADAVITGARTVNQFPVTLSSGGARYRRQRRLAGKAEEPIRVVVSGTGSVNPKAELFKHTFSPIIVLTTKRMPAARQRQLQSLGATVEICGDKTINFKRALPWLKKEWGVKSLLCEGGGVLNQSLIQAGLVNEINLTVCPLIFGGRNSPTLADGPGVSRLAQASNFQLRLMKQVNNELYLTYRSQ